MQDVSQKDLKSIYNLRQCCFYFPLKNTFLSFYSWLLFYQEHPQSIPLFITEMRIVLSTDVIVSNLLQLNPVFAHSTIWNWDSVIWNETIHTCTFHCTEFAKKIARIDQFNFARLRVNVGLALYRTVFRLWIMHRCMMESVIFRLVEYIDIKTTEISYSYCTRAWHIGLFIRDI